MNVTVSMFEDLVESLFGHADQLLAGRVDLSSFDVPDGSAADVLRRGLEEALVWGPAFDRLFALAVRDHRRVRSKVSRTEEPLQDEDSLPAGLCRHILQNGIVNVAPLDLVRLITNPLWLAELWDALDCLPPFWAERARQLRQERSARQEWLIKVAVAQLDGVRKAEKPVAEESLVGLFQHLFPRLRVVLEAEAAGRADAIEDSLQQAFANLWRKRSRWRAGEAGLEDLLSLAFRQLRRRLRASAPPPPPPPPIGLLPPVSTDQINRLREGFPDLPLCDQELLRVIETDGHAACVSPAVCRDLKLSPKDAAERLTSLNLFLWDGSLPASRM